MAEVLAVYLSISLGIYFLYSYWRRDVKRSLKWMIKQSQKEENFLSDEMELEGMTNDVTNVTKRFPPPPPPPPPIV